MTKQGGYDATPAALATKPNAIFAINDEIAIGLYRGIEEAGLKIPEDISVVGYDDIDLSEYIYPKLTTIHQPAFEMGTNAAQMIIKRIENQNQPIQRISLPVSLVERNSVNQID